MLSAAGISELKFSSGFAALILQRRYLPTSDFSEFSWKMLEILTSFLSYKTWEGKKRKDYVTSDFHELTSSVDV